MMNRLLNRKNHKDKFIIETLLPYFVDHIEDSDIKSEIVDQISSMYVFPYKTSEGTKLGSLKEPGISWYFDKNEENKIVSSGGYRIIDDSVMSEKNASNFRKTFSEYCGISKFSDHVVIEDLLEKMSKETDYTRRWWIYAYDVFTLWRKGDFNSSLEKATEGMQNNRFLFIDGEYSESFKQRLLEYGVFRDIRETSFKTHFWNLIKNCSDQEKAIDVLIRMGVPHTFVAEGKVNEYLVKFFEQISKNADYPVEFWEREFEQCELIHDIILEIYREDQNAFIKIATDSDINVGMVLKNILGAYVPLSWDLFYSSEKQKSEDDSRNSDDNSEVYTNSDLESLHLNSIEYPNDLLKILENTHEFSDVCKLADEYNLGIKSTAIDFYKWIWEYSKHINLISNILCYFTDKEVLHNNSDIKFALEVLNEDEIKDEGYYFSFELNIEEAFENSRVLAKIAKLFKNISCTVKVAAEEKLDKTIFFQQLISAIDNPTILQKVLMDPIWDRVFIVEENIDLYYGMYVICKDEYESNKIFLCQSDNIKSYIVSLAKYVEEFYDIEISMDDLSEINWKKAYINLVNGIRSFVNFHTDIVLESDIYQCNVNLDDIKTFGEEKSLWIKLKEQRKKIMEIEQGEIPVTLLDNRNYLKAKYNGRCQLCGNMVPKNSQDSYFYTYRIVKKSKNPLADMRYNLFCLCPTCHGALEYGRFMGQDMSDIVEKASKYASYLESKIESNEMEDEFPCLVRELVDHAVEIPGFKEPFTCNVIVNGKERAMAFSWEHFIKIAFIFSDMNDFDKEDDFTYEKSNLDYECEQEIIDAHIPQSTYHPHGYEPWHGTEWVSGHFRNRNGHTEWVRGHWRTR